MIFSSTLLPQTQDPKETQKAILDLLAKINQTETGANILALLSTVLGANWITALKAALGSGWTTALAAASTSGSSNLIDAASVNGLTIGAVTTWTPGLTFGGGNTGITYSVDTGKYIRIGNVVLFTAYIVLSSKGTSVGNALITNLPYSAIASMYPAIKMNIANITYTGMAQGYVVAGSSTISLRYATEAGADSSMTDANFSNTSNFVVSGEYYI